MFVLLVIPLELLELFTSIRNFQGTAYVYDTFLKPYVAKHETEIDRNLLELRAKAGDIAVLYWQRAASYGHTRIFEIMRFAASQSPRPHPAQVPIDRDK